MQRMMNALNHALRSWGLEWKKASLDCEHWVPLAKQFSRRRWVGVSNSTGTHKKLCGILYLVELFGIDELEEFRRGVELASRPDQNGQCDHLGS
eukprot:7629194-Pyramimonas_sp.AAC.1